MVHTSNGVDQVRPILRSMHYERIEFGTDAKHIRVTYCRFIKKTKDVGRVIILKLLPFRFGMKYNITGKFIMHPNLRLHHYLQSCLMRILNAGGNSLWFFTPPTMLGVEIYFRLIASHERKWEKTYI